MTAELADRVRENPDLEPLEKETAIGFDKTRDSADIFTAEAGLMRRLLQHPLFTPRYITLSDGRRVENVEELHADGAAIVSVGGSIPIGALKVRSAARTAAGHAAVVSRGGDGE